MTVMTMHRHVLDTVRSSMLILLVFAVCAGCSVRPDTPAPSADPNDILKNSDGTVGPMKGTPGNP
jgi:hypothetical protein